MSNQLTFKLKSGRVLLLHQPLTAEERAECESDEAMAILERIADRIAERATREIDIDSGEGEQMRLKYGIQKEG